MEFLQRAGGALFITMQYVLPQQLLTRAMRWLSSNSVADSSRMIVTPSGNDRRSAAAPGKPMV
ncbi:MAG: hypothetical protein AAFQ16_13660, partial [Pseudomonadota bacterium]